MNLHQAQNTMKKYVLLKRPRSWLIRAKGSHQLRLHRVSAWAGNVWQAVQIITNYLPLANYLIDQEHEA